MNSSSAPVHDIIVIGASAGGLRALLDIIGDLPIDLPATIFAVIHRHPESVDMMSHILSGGGSLPVVQPYEGQRYERSHIYLAPPDRHMLIDGDRIRLSSGPRENRSRPAIDPLFRSAAVAGRRRTVGIILCGMLDDGVSGLVAIRRCGGRTIVRDPEEALFPEMPRAAVERADPDMILSLREITHEIIRLAGSSVDPTDIDIPEDLVMETEIALGKNLDDVSHKLGPLVQLGCPECGGPLRQKSGEAGARFRCHVGHSYTATSLIEEQDDSLEKALWVALRTLEERARTLDMLERESRERSMRQTADLYGGRARETRQEADSVRSVLLRRRTERLGRQSAAD